jgi:hypothetical protein
MAQVTRLPHDGRMIMGGKGVILMPPNAAPTDPAHTPAPDPMLPAAEAYEKAMRALCMDKPDSDEPGKAAYPCT